MSQYTSPVQILLFTQRPDVRGTRLALHLDCVHGQRWTIACVKLLYLVTLGWLINNRPKTMPLFHQKMSLILFVVFCCCCCCFFCFFFFFFFFWMSWWWYHIPFSLFQNINIFVTYSTTVNIWSVFHLYVCHISSFISSKKERSSIFPKMLKEPLIQIER